MNEVSGTQMTTTELQQNLRMYVWITIHINVSSGRPTAEKASRKRGLDFSGCKSGVFGYLRIPR